MSDSRVLSGLDRALMDLDRAIDAAGALESSPFTATVKPAQPKQNSKTTKARALMLVEQAIRTCDPDIVDLTYENVQINRTKGYTLDNWRWQGRWRGTRNETIRGSVTPVPIVITLNSLSTMTEIVKAGRAVAQADQRVSPMYGALRGLFECCARSE